MFDHTNEMQWRGTTVRAGFKFGTGFLCAYFLVKLLSAIFMDAFSLNKTDDSDGPEERSGLRVHVDHKTGVEYLSAPNGGLVVRVQEKAK